MRRRRYDRYAREHGCAEQPAFGGAPALSLSSQPRSRAAMRGVFGGRAAVDWEAGRALCGLSRRGVSRRRVFIAAMDLSGALRLIAAPAAARSAAGSFRP